jgi:UDP-2-acetamido-3-amino-2,3-dideoxy-glucuronate N-acetyltransferase
MTVRSRFSARPDGSWVAPQAQLDDDVELGPGVVVGAGARIGRGSRLGPGVIVEPGTELGPDCLVEPHAVLGKPPRLRRGSQAVGATGPLRIAGGVTVCAGAVIYAGARIARGVIVGDQAHVRERTEIGEATIIGRASTVDFATRIGARVSIQTLVYITAHTVIEDDVFLGPGVVTTNDDTMGRHSRDRPLRGPILRRGCRIGGGAVITPGAEVGEEAFVAAGAVVTGDVAARGVVMGIPGRLVREVGDEDLLERWREDG